MKERTYIAIDLKSFYASVECVYRKLGPMQVNLVVADAERTEKTICLAVSPALKAWGIPGRARLFEVVEKVGQINQERQMKAPGQMLQGKSCCAQELADCPEKALDYITAPPRMAAYVETSTKIYDIYLQFVAPEDIHVYSIDEVFIDVTAYLATYRMTGKELAREMIREVFRQTGITATAGVAPNLYLCKVAMDMLAKRAQPDEYGVRIAELDEMSYRRQLWSHRPLTDFWRIGHGYARKLEQHGMYTMGDVARCSLGQAGTYHNEALLYKLFGVNAELLIDHAWGWEPCTIADIKAYTPAATSLSSGQVLSEPYPYDKARIIVQEMAENMSLDLVEKGLTTDQLVLAIGYDIENLKDPAKQQRYAAEATMDFYGRLVPKPAHGSLNLSGPTSSTREIVRAAEALFDRIADPALLVRRVTIAASHTEAESTEPPVPEQLDMFTDYQSLWQRQAQEAQARAREKNIQQAMLHLRRRYGKNALLKGMNLQEGATGMQRNRQIGGHKA